MNDETFPKMLRFTHTIESNIQVDGPALEAKVIEVFQTEAIRDKATQAFLAVISDEVKKRKADQVIILGQPQKV